MSEKIRVHELNDHEYGVDVTQGTLTTHHRVVVPTEMLDDLGLAPTDEARLVEETVAFLLDREPSTSIDDEFPLDVVASRFPDYADELRTRLA